MAGPRGQKVSKDLPRANCPPPRSLSRCQSRAVTSFGAGVAKDVIHRLVAGDVLGILADDDGELGLEIDFGTAPRDENRIAGVVERVAGFDEEHGVPGHLRAALGGVLAIVEADAEDVGGNPGGEQFVDGEDVFGNAIAGEESAFNSHRAFGVKFFAAMDFAAGEETDDSHGRDSTRKET